MVFSSITFLFFFLPLTLLGYYICRRQDARNRWLLFASLGFYTWGGGSFVLYLLASITTNFALGLKVSNARETGNEKQKRLWVTLAILLNIALLGYYKYANFFIQEYNHAVGIFGFGMPLEWTKIILPIGISFFTFHAMSYVFDVARGLCRPQRSFTRFALYISLFPQLIAGPIVRYHDVSDQLPEREHSIDKFYFGAARFLHGLLKKLVIADSVGAIAGAVFGLPLPELSTSAAWLGVFAYTIQIYFDFSAYSDMAVGLGMLFGLRFPENFRRPYSALSITDFWRRWHMTLSSWIREYLYIPLGGSRVSTRRMYGNLVTVFFLTGLWHGANWTFIAWGVYHGALLVIERLTGQREATSFLPLRRALTLFLVLIGWVMFRADHIHQAWHFYAQMFHMDHLPLPASLDGALTHRNIATLLLASLVFFLPAKCCAANWMENNSLLAESYRWFLLLIGVPCAIALIVSGTFSPFLYFQF